MNLSPWVQPDNWYCTKSHEYLIIFRVKYCILKHFLPHENDLKDYFDSDVNMACFMEVLVALLYQS